VKRLLQSTYVDDIVTGADSDEVAFELYTQSKMIFRLGGFNLRKFLSNNRALQTAAEKPPDYNPSPASNQAVREEVKVLGVTWDPDSDFLI
jgi:hypothetical protein